MTTRHRSMWLLLLVLSVQSLSSQADPTKEQRIALPGQGYLKLTVPVGWKQQIDQPPGQMPPTILFQPERGPAFAVLITPVWPLRADITLPTSDELRRRVADTAERIRPRAVEKTLELKELRGTSGLGYYYAATDKAPKPGEFLYMTQGILRVDNLLVSFTILTNPGQPQVVVDALSLLQSAIHLHP